MKTILFLFFFSIFSFTYSQEWKFLLTTGESEYFYRPNNSETAWFKIVSAKTEYYDKSLRKLKTVDGHKILLCKFDCENKKMGLIKFTTYNKEGKVIEYDSKNEVLVNMDYVNPDSVGEAMLYEFCKL